MGTPESVPENTLESWSIVHRIAAFVNRALLLRFSFVAPLR